MVVLLKKRERRNPILVIDQDRENHYLYDGTQKLRAEKVMYDGIIIAYKVTINGENIGTFDYLTDALMEISHIEECNVKYYTVSGFEGGEW